MRGTRPGMTATAITATIAERSLRPNRKTSPVQGASEALRVLRPSVLRWPETHYGTERFSRKER